MMVEYSEKFALALLCAVAEFRPSGGSGVTLLGIADERKLIIMARDSGLEELVNDELGSVPGITNKAMFGGWAWMLNGNLLCGARVDGMLVRLGKGNDAWALELRGVKPMISRGKHMHGWVRADSSVYGNDKTRHKLITYALKFVNSLPRK